VAVIGHPYANERIGMATIHAKELAVAAPFRRLLGAEVVVAHGLDTDALGTFSGEVPRPDALIETCIMKAELAFRSLDVDCAIASEGSYGPIERVPLVASGVEIMIQYALMFGMLSSIRRATAMFFRSRKPVVRGM